MDLLLLVVIVLVLVGAMFLAWLDHQRARADARRRRLAVHLVQLRAERQLYQVTHDGLQAMLDEARQRRSGGTS